MTVIISENLDSYLYLLIAVLVFSFDSTLILLLTQSNVGFWTIIFWRQLIQLFTILLVYITPLLFQNKHVINGLRDKFSKIGIWGVVAGLLYAVDNAAYIIAIANTYTINVYLFFAFSPVFIAILSYFINNDLLDFKLILTAIVCSIAVSYIFYADVVNDYDKPLDKDDDDIGSRGTNWYIVYGNLMALVGSFSYAVYMVLISKLIKDSGDDHVDLSLCLVVSSATQCIAAVAIGVEWNSINDIKDIANLLLQGGIGAPVFGSLMVSSLRNIPHITAATFTESLSLILQTFWVWFFGFSDPPYLSIATGAVVVVTLWMYHFLKEFDEVNRVGSKHFIYNPAPLDDDTEEDVSLALESKSNRKKGVIV